MTSSNGTIFRVIGPLCGEFTGPGEFPAQRPGTRSFGVFFDLCLNKRLSKQPWGWWFETPSWSLWRQCNAEWLHSLLSTNGQVFTSVGLFACNNITEKGWKGIFMKSSGYVRINLEHLGDVPGHHLDTRFFSGGIRGGNPWLYIRHEKIFNKFSGYTGQRTRNNL